MAVNGLARCVRRCGANLVMVCALAAGLVAWAGGPTASGAARTGPGPGTARVFAGGVGGPARGRTVALTSPCGVAFGGGHVSFTDSSGVFSPTGTARLEITDVVRNLNPRTGWMTTVAGVGVPGTYGDRGPASRAELSQPCAVTFDHHGNLIIVNSPQVRVIAARAGTFYGERMQARHIYTIATSPIPLRGVAVDYAGNVVLSTPQGTRAAIFVLAARSGSFYGRAMRTGHIYQVWRARFAGANDLIGPVTVDLAGNPLVVGGNVFVVAARSGTFDGRRMLAGHTYTLSTLHTAIPVSGGDPATMDRHGNVVMASAVVSCLAVLAMRTGTFYGRAMRAGHVYQISKRFGFAGDGGLVADAKFNNIRGLTTDGSGNVLIADTGNHRLRVLAVRSGTFYGIRMRADHVYTVAGNGSVNSDSGDGGPATRAQLWQSVFRGGGGSNFAGLAADRAGNVFMSDTFNNRIRMVPSRAGTFFGQRMRAGDIYTIAGTGGAGGYSGDGGPARQAQIQFPAGLGLDGHGNVLFVDAENSVVRVVAGRSGTLYGIAMRAGHIYTIAGGGTQTVSGVPATAAALDPVGLAVDHAGNVLVSNGVFGGVSGVWAVAARSGTFYGQQMTAGHIYQVAGGGLTLGDGVPAVAANLPNTAGVAVDGAGNVIIADLYQNPQQAFRVRVVAVGTGVFYGQQMTAGDIYTIAGGGTERGSGHLATQARLQGPRGIAIDRSGNVLVTVGNGRLQVIAFRSGTFYGRRMTGLHLYTIAGGGAGIVPDNRLATKIALLRPQGIAIDPAGDVLVSAASEGRVILVRG